MKNKEKPKPPIPPKYTYDLEIFVHMDVSENSGTPKSSILIGFSIINHPFWGTPVFGNTHIHDDVQLVRVN